MDVPEEEIISQRYGDAVERIGDEINIVERAQRWLMSTEHVVNLNGAATRECPTPKVVANESPKATQSPVGIGRGQESMKHVSVQFATKKDSLPASSARQFRASTWLGCIRWPSFRALLSGNRHVR